ncbi:MAG: YrdB family protein [Bacteroidetes bacterium]|nr:YrdB family protein [Bacteroidota bacterium]
MTLLKTLNLALAFILELFMLYAMGYWGFHLKQSTGIRWFVGIGLPVVVAIVWGIFLAPKSVMQTPPTVKMLGKLVLMESSAVLLYTTGKTNMAITFAIATAVNIMLVFVWKQF